MRSISLLICCWSLCLTIAKAQTDTTVLSYAEYLSNILAYHPVAKQAALRIDFAKTEWLAAKGNLDPKLSSNWNQKNFADKLYYQQFQSKLQIPTRLGIDIVGAYENTAGVFLNPENRTDQFGLWNLGVEANLIQGLLVNERKIALEQANVFQAIAKNQQDLILNELLYAASLAYLDWQKYDAFQSVIRENITLASNYADNTKSAFENGEKTAMDTLEAMIILQAANTLWQSNEAALAKSRQKLENFLWFKELPLALQRTTQPQNYQTAIFVIDNSLSISNSLNQNPILVEKRNKQTYLALEQKLKREKLKPKLKAKYNPLMASSANSIAPNFSISDYKWGLDFSMPLFRRKEKANVQKGEIKLKEIQLDIQNKQNELQNKIENSREQQAILNEQINLIQQNVDGYKRLLDGENEKFKFGESSVFLVNKRQEKYIDGRLKLIELNIKLRTEKLNYLYLRNELIIE